MKNISNNNNNEQQKSFSVNRILAALLVCCVVGGCGKPSVDKLLTDAKTLHQKGDNAAAVIQLKNVVQREPKNTEARQYLGKLYLEAGDPYSAEKEFRQALKLGYPSEKVLPLLGRSLLQQEEFKKVLEDTRSSKYGESALTAEVIAIRGHAQLSLALDDEAEESFNNALKKQPNLADALLGLARIALLKSDQSSALNYVNRALVSAPKNADAWVMKGDLDRIVERKVEAKEAYRKAVRIEPGNIAANINLASMHIAAGEFDEARRNIEILKQASPDNPLAYYLSGVIDLRAGNYKNADAAAKETIKLSPNYLPGSALAGAIAYASGSLGRAEEYLRGVVEKNPNGVYARKLLAATLIKSDKADQALEVLTPAIEAFPNDPSLLAIAAEASTKSGNFDKAVTYYEKIASLVPKNAEAHLRLGAARFASGEKDAALADLDSAAILESNKSQGNILKALTYISRKQYKDALPIIEAIKKEQPDNPLAYNLEAAIFAGTGKLSAARTSLEKAVSLRSDFFPAIINLAKLDLVEKDPKAARKRFEPILKKDPTNLQTLMAMANLGSKLGATQEEIVKWLETARNGNPQALAPRMLLARNYLQQGNNKKAVEIANEARKVAPTSFEPVELLGIARLANGDSNGAVQTFSGLVTQFPKSSDARLLLAQAHLANQNQPAAAIALTKALELTPKFLPAQTLLADINVQSGRLNEAMKIANQLMIDFPKSPAGKLLEGDVLLAQKKYPQALVAYEKAYTIEKSSISIIKQYQALMASGSVQQADNRISAWLKEHPQDNDTRLFYASTNFKSGQYKKASDQYEKILETDPKNEYILNNLAWTYFNLNDPRDVKLAAAAYELNPQSPQITDTYGWILVNRGRVEKGLDLLDRATTLAPEHQEIRYHFAVALDKANRKDEATKELERLLSSRTPFPQKEEALALLKQLKN